MKLNEIVNVDENKIHKTLNDWGVLFSYNIDNNGLINIPQSSFTVKPEYLIDGELPPHINFGKIGSNFSFWECADILKSIRGAPQEITGSFSISQCKNIKTFENFPKKIDDRGVISGSGITSLIGINDFVDEIGSLVFEPSEIESGGLGLCLIKSEHLPIPNTHPNHRPFEIISRYLNRPNDIFECQSELIEAGFDEFAQI